MGGEMSGFCRALPRAGSPKPLLDWRPARSWSRRASTLSGKASVSSIPMIFSRDPGLLTKCICRSEPRHA